MKVSGVTVLDEGLGAREATVHGRHVQRTLPIATLETKRHKRGKGSGELKGMTRTQGSRDATRMEETAGLNLGAVNIPPRVQPTLPLLNQYQVRGDPLKH